MNMGEMEKATSESFQNGRERGRKNQGLSMKLRWRWSHIVIPFIHFLQMTEFQRGKQMSGPQGLPMAEVGGRGIMTHKRSPERHLGSYGIVLSWLQELLHYNNDTEWCLSVCTNGYQGQIAVWYKLQFMQKVCVEETWDFSMLPLQLPVSL